jgi:hypothetical protein
LHEKNHVHASFDEHKNSQIASNLGGYPFNLTCPGLASGILLNSRGFSSRRAVTRAILAGIIYYSKQALKLVILPFTFLEAKTWQNSLAGR